MYMVDVIPCVLKHLADTMITSRRVEMPGAA